MFVSVGGALCLLIHHCSLLHTFFFFFSSVTPNKLLVVLTHVAVRLSSERFLFRRAKASRLSHSCVISICTARCSDLGVVVPELLQHNEPVKLCFFTVASSVGVPRPQRASQANQIGVKDIKERFLLFCCSAGRTCGGCVWGIVCTWVPTLLRKGRQDTAKTCVFVHVPFD